MIMLNRTKVSQLVSSDVLAAWFVILVLLAALAALMLSGCGGDSGPGLTATSTGWKCDVPSTTMGDVSTKYFVVVEDDVAAACEETKAWATKNPSQAAAILPSVANGQISIQGADCSDAAHDFQGTSGTPWCVKLAQSVNVASNTIYNTPTVSTLESGQKCTGLPSDGSTCLASVVYTSSSYEDPEGGVCGAYGTYSDTFGIDSPVCVAAAISPVNTSPQKQDGSMMGDDGIWAICSTTGTFLGWMCTDGE
jgi:hypothetical protein